MIRKSLTLSLQEKIEQRRQSGKKVYSLSNPTFNSKTLNKISLRSYNLQGKLTGEQTEFDFGEEGDRLVEIVTDPIQFNATRESGDADSRVYWGKNFLTVNVDNGDVPVNIDLRPGKYNATQLAAEVERAINTAYGDDSKIQVVQNVDDTLSINLFKLNADGSSTGLTTAVSVDLLADSYVSTVEGITLTEKFSN